MYKTELGYVFSFGEIWGSAPCHVCGESEYLTVISEEEYAKVKGMSGSDACAYIVTEKLGKPVCPQHAGVPLSAEPVTTASDLCAMAKTDRPGDDKL